MLSSLGFFRLIEPSSSEPTDTIARLEPSSIIFGPRGCVGETFTLTVHIDNVSDLWTVGIEITWNATVFDYVGHVTKIPRNTYPDGILWEPIIQVVDGLVQDGEFELLYGILYGIPFSGSGIVCEVTFEIEYQPLQNEPNQNFTMEWVSAIRNETDWIPHLQENCAITINALPSPDVNNDGTVDIFDIVSVASIYGHTEIDIDWNPWADLAPEWGIIDIFDIVTCASHYGETY